MKQIGSSIDFFRDFLEQSKLLDMEEICILMLDAYKVHTGDKKQVNGEDFNRLKQEVSRQGSSEKCSENAWGQSEDELVQ